MSRREAPLDREKRSKGVNKGGEVDQAGGESDCKGCNPNWRSEREPLIEDLAPDSSDELPLSQKLQNWGTVSHVYAPRETGHLEYA